MGYSYIEKAIAAITNMSMNSHILADRVSLSLSRKSKAQVSAIDSSLNFTFPFYRTRPSDLDRLIKLRRASLLISKTIETRLVRLTGGNYSPDSWDEMELDEYITRRIAEATSTAPGGTLKPFLTGSFWAYANEEERSSVLVAHSEAIALCTYGLNAAKRAVRGSPRICGDSRVDLYFDLVRMWFGEGEDTPEKVKKNLSLTLTALMSKRIGFGYAGTGITNTGSNFREVGFSMPDLGEVRTLTGWGHVFAKNADRIVLDRNFFDPTLTSAALEGQIVAIDSNDYRVTRGGAVLHEATHLYAHTHDVEVNDRAYAKLGWDLPKAPGDREKGYGPLICLALAKETPDLAVKNADSYRIFCELAKYHWDRLEH